jgi:serine/threonine protein kinase
MEMMSGGELFDYVVEKGTLSELEASRIVRKITSAIALMHSMGIIHRDLKPENLLLTSKGPNAEVKLIDFGLAKVGSSSSSLSLSAAMQKITNDSVAHSFLGTRGYLAPEMLQRHTYDKAIDIWVGVSLYPLLTLASTPLSYTGLGYHRVCPVVWVPSLR